MNAIEPRHSAAEFKEWGDRIYNEEIRPRLSEEDHGKFIAIDIEGRGYELADRPTPACDKLYERIPDAQLWLKRVGYPAPYSLGWHGGTTKP